MRITKVKVGNEMVLMHRTNKEGALIKGETLINQTGNILPKEKIDNFKKSLIDKTLVKESKHKGKNKRNKAIENVLNSLLLKRYLNGLYKIDKQTIIDSLQPKFKNDFTYKPNDKEPITFNLVDMLYRYSQNNNDKNIFQPYIDWVNWYIDTRSKYLIKSIENNKIELSNGELENLSKRKLVLIELAQLSLKERQRDYYSDLEKIYNFEGLKSNINKYISDELQGEEVNYSKLNKEIKTLLKEHQRTIFGTRDNPNNENREDDFLAIYNNEVVKYFEHYFPVKKSARTYTIASYKYHLKVSTIQSTIRHQFENAIRLNMLKDGKLLHHNFKEITSKDLIQTKNQEAFVLSMLDACAFAANNIRNIIDNEQASDILGKKEFIKSINKNNIDKFLYELFFNNQYDNNQLTLWAIRSSTQWIRNNIIHYNKGAIKDIFNIKEFEYPLKGKYRNTEPFNSTIFKEYLSEDLKNTNSYIANQLMSGGILSYYSMDNIKDILNKIEFNLCRTSVPFTPSFKKVFKAGCNYCTNDIEKNGMHYLNIKNYKPKQDIKEEKDEEYQARYFLLKLLYNNIFLADFKDKDFRKTSKQVLRSNKEKAIEQDKKFEYAFKEIREIKDNESVNDYMSYVQSYMALEKIRKDERKFRANTEERNNFEKFLLDIYIKGFDEFLNKFEDINIHNVEYQFDLSLTNQAKADELKARKEEITPFCNIKQGGINTENSSHIGFYVFCKLLDANHLSNLRNEIIKYRQSQQKGISDDKINLDIERLLETIELCLQRVDAIKISQAHKVQVDEESIKPFVESSKALKDFGDLYVQLDDSTIVVHSSIELFKKYGTEQRLIGLVEKHNNFKVQFKDYEIWKKFRAKKEENKFSEIEYKIARKQDLHKQWVKGEFKTFEKTGKDWTPTKKAKEYHGLANEIEEYVWLDNKLHFVHLKKIHSLTIDILGRMAGFVAIFDRDFLMMDSQRTEDKFQLLEIFNFDKEMGKDSENLDNLRSLYDWDMVQNKKIIKRDGRGIIENDKKELIECLKSKRKFFKSTLLYGNYTMQNRNYIAHFNYLTAKDINYSLIDLINNLRDLMSYDRKLKNAITKSIIDIFDRNGMELKFKFSQDKHRLEVDTIKPKLIHHLGTKSKNKITTNLVSQEYCNICKALLEIKK